ncbi:MAG: NHLP family bacteriocin export ABC transporter peptidase/permease/ATPase subunit [Coriobacteriales bacterium]|nr:NHLP family bacteriocin export ABC transporter peptidase/permease/ATPase subunit [Coriobacteriales bacterium]
MPRGVKKVPVVMQMEALECGAASLAMILAYYGRWVPLEELRVACGVSRDGSRAGNILRAARRYGLKASGWAYPLESLKQVNFPCIIFWNFNHFVVLDGFRGKYAYLNDPARGEIRVTMDEFDKSYTGVTLLFEPDEGFEPGGSQPSVVRFVMSRLRGMGSPILFAALTTGIVSLIGIISMSLSRVFLDRVLTGDNSSWIEPLVTLMIGLAIISGVVSALSAIYLARIQGKIGVVASSRFMRHLLHLPSGFYEQRMVGDLQQRQSSNETVAFQLIGQLAPVLMNIAMLVLYLVVMLQMSPVLTLVGVSVVVANAFLARSISKKRVNIARMSAMSAGKLYATQVAGIDAIETIKASGAENAYFQKWAGYQAALNKGSMQATALNTYLGSVPEMLVQIANIGVLLLGTYFIIAGNFTQGALLAFQGFLTSFMNPVNQMITLSQTVQEMQTQMERIDDVMRYEVDVPEEMSDEEIDRAFSFGREKLRGSVDLSGVTFGYSPLDPPLIENFDLHLEPGKWVALVGGSGSGKSTIAKLVSGLYQPWSGEVRFDGVLASEIPMPIMRGSLAVVDQDIATFDDTISDNVRLWDKSIEDFEVIMACNDAQIHQIIMERPGGYSSRILPGGRNFSGGQLQRMEIARVLASDPSIIILDEATSALDAKTEEAVINAIRDRGNTCIVVAHRLSTIRDCDEIVVLDRGKVQERGTHDELLAEGGAYAKLVRSD